MNILKIIIEEIESFVSAKEPKINALENPNFKNWFKNSKIVNSDGTPQIVYHETSIENEKSILKTQFDINKLGARKSDELMPNGFFFKPTNSNIGVSSTMNNTQMSVYLSIQNPFVVNDREDLHNKLIQISPKFKKLDDYFKQNDLELKRSVENEFNRIKTIENREERVKEYDKLKVHVIDSWSDWCNETTDKIRNLVRKTLIDSGYDGLIMDNDGGSRGRVVKTIIAFNPNQIKSVNNNGEFSTSDNNIMREDELNENMDTYGWYELHSNLNYKIFQMINNKQHIKFYLIPKLQYQRALQEFVKYGEFMRFPEAKIFQWKDLVLENIAKLEVLTAIGGHTSDFPYYEFYDVFDYNQETGDERDGEFSAWCKMKYEETGDDDYTKDYNFQAAYKFLDEVKHMDDYLPLFSNGQWVLSDFGLQPLFKIGQELAENNNANEIIVLINRALDVTHQRSDLAEIFIEGGTPTLDAISAGHLVY